MNINPKQIAREMAEKCAEVIVNSYPHPSSCWSGGMTNQIKATSEIILTELNFEQLIADKQRLDWLSQRGTEVNVDDNGTAHIWMGHSTASIHFQGFTLREALSNAIAGKEYPKPKVGYDDITGGWQH